MQSMIVIGDSNVCRLRIPNSDIKNLSKSGMSFNDVPKFISNVKTNETVRSVVVHLGTNDVKHVDKTVVVVKRAKNPLISLKDKWLGAKIAYSSIIPRVGKSTVVKQFNSDATFIKNSILQYCLSTKRFRYIDIDEIFLNNGAVAKSLYDPDDPSGIHVNIDGSVSLYDNLEAFLERCISDERDLVPLGKKRLRSRESITSPSEAQRFKQGKTVDVD